MSTVLAVSARDRRCPEGRAASWNADPVEFGGEGAGFAAIAEICTTHGQACASSAMIFAMHHIKCSSLVEHAEGNAWQRDFMAGSRANNC